MHYFIGVDIGGTNIKIGLVNEQGKPLAQHSYPTKSDDGPQPVVDAIANEVKLLARQNNIAMKDIAGVGIGSPGPLDLANGIVRATPNISGWRDVPLRDMISRATGLPAILENDANAAAFGEYWAGAGRDPDVRFLVMLTLGTGVGCGIVDDGHLIHGVNGFAGEGGHVIVEPNGRLCGCGQRGCIEAYASASHMARITIERLEAGEASSLQDLRKQGQAITSREIFAHAEKGDALALSMVDQTANYLGLLCVSICRLLDPQMIVFAGGMILAGEFLFTRIREAYHRHTWTILKDKVRIVPAELGNDAGFIGAAAVAWDGHKRGALVSAKS
jgi:glucokinase